jgi:hypothetical protein
MHQCVIYRQWVSYCRVGCGGLWEGGGLEHLRVLCFVAVVVVYSPPEERSKQASRGVSRVGPVGSATVNGVDPHKEVVRPAHPPLGQHGHRTLTPRPESPLVQLRAARG